MREQHPSPSEQEKQLPELVSEDSVTVDVETVKSILVSLAVAEHSGDVADDLPRLCRALGLPEPEWTSERLRYVMAWEEKDE